MRPPRADYARRDVARIGGIDEGGVAKASVQLADRVRVLTIVKSLYRRHIPLKI